MGLGDILRKDKYCDLHPLPMACMFGHIWGMQRKNQNTGNCLQEHMKCKPLTPLTIFNLNNDIPDCSCFRVHPSHYDDGRICSTCCHDSHSRGTLELCAYSLWEIKGANVILNRSRAVAGVAQWIECRPANWRVASLISRQGACWVAGQVPSRGRVRGNHTLMFLSLSFFLPSPFSKNK